MRLPAFAYKMLWENLRVVFRNGFAFKCAPLPRKNQHGAAIAKRSPAKLSGSICVLHFAMGLLENAHLPNTNLGADALAKLLIKNALGAPAPCNLRRVWLKTTFPIHTYAAMRLPNLRIQNDTGPPACCISQRLCLKM